MSDTAAQIKQERELILLRSKIKQQLLQRLETALCGNYLKKRNAERVSIIEANANLHGNSQSCMRVGAEVWGRDLYMKHRVPLPREINLPHPKIQERLETFLAFEESQEAQDYKMVMSSIRGILSQTPSYKDYEEIFPEKLHPVLRSSALQAAFQDRTEHFLDAAQREHLKTSQQKYLHLMRILMTRHLLNMD